MQDIEFDIFDPDSIDEAIKELETLEVYLESGLPDDVVDKVTEVGVEEAAPIFANAPYDGNNDVTVKAKPAQNGTGYVNAAGKAAGFIEFGTGKDVGKGETLPRPSGWGLGEYRPNSGGSHPPWVYTGPMGKNPATGILASKKKKGGGYEIRKGKVTTWGNPPAGAMLQASRVMEAYAPDAVKEVLAKW